MPRPTTLTFLLVAACAAPAAPARAQTAQPPPKNLQVLPNDTARPALIQRMREFSFALGVRCQYCHVGGNGVSFDGVVFESDEKLPKQKARAMMRMVDALNTSVLPQLPGRASSGATVDCVTCHRGLPVPKTIDTVLLETVEHDGAAAAVQKYRDLRAKESMMGRWDFDEWRVNEVARVLQERKNPDAAIALLEMNGEFYPQSTAVDTQLAELFRARGDTAKALERYRAALRKDPNNSRARQMIAELESRKE
jgi:tetratricopeptide (TPR) repeat protein